jgi:hypothetical protein
MTKIDKEKYMKYFPCCALPISLPSPIPPQTVCCPITHNICGDFFIEIRQKINLQLWKADGNTSSLMSFSLCNSKFSRSPITVNIFGSSVENLIIYPGNTGTFTGRNIKVINILNEGRNDFILEGKFSIKITY